MPTQSHTNTKYSLDPEQLVSQTTSPYTPEQRTALVTDVLCHFQERPDTDSLDADEEWDKLYEKVTTGDDDTLEAMWEPVGRWIVSRRDVPGADTDPVVGELRDETDLDEGNAILVHQLYKRFTDSLKPDYGFLGFAVYYHETDPRESR